MRGMKNGRSALAMVLVVALVVAAGRSLGGSPDTGAVAATSVAHLAAAGATGVTAVAAGPVAASTRSAGVMVVEVESVVGCRWSAEDRVADAGRNRRVVELAYCGLLRRPSDEAGLAYWTGELDRGVPVGELLLALLDSPEYRVGRDRTPIESLAGFRRASPTSSTTGGGGEVATSDTGSSRRVLTATAFDRWVADRQLDSVDAVTDALVHGRIATDDQRINVVYAHLSATRGARVSPADRGRSAVGTWAEEIGAHAAINGNWYGPWDGPAVSGGVPYGGSDHFYTALFGFTAGGEVVVEHHREINRGVDPRIVEGVSGHPTLIFDGERTTDFGADSTFTARHPRTAIGVDATGDVLILVTVDGRSSVARGMTGDETARLMERLGAHHAVMLDGGGSTTMWVAGRGVVNQPSGALRSVGNQLAVFGD